MIKRQKLNINTNVLFNLPTDARVIDFAAGRNVPGMEEYIDMWYDDPGQSEGQLAPYRLQIRATGMDAPEGAMHLKTIVTPSGKVWHLYIAP